MERRQQTAHRPWPVPKAPWVMTQSWENLLFVHWPIAPALLRAKIPAPLELDTFAGQAWLTIVPFQMNHIRFRFLPTIPGMRFFPELNVRTYVTYGGKQGVYFFNIEAAHRLAVWVARHFAYLPYAYATIDCQKTDEQVSFACQRNGKRYFIADYRPVSAAQTARTGTLDHWLMERYCLYTMHRQQVYRGEVHHRPWPLRQAEVTIWQNEIFAHHQLNKEGDPVFHYVDRLQMRAWPFRRC
jgi:uncharacterized protein